MIDFSALFQAIAIEARCRLRWGGVNDETRRIMTQRKAISIPYLPPYTASYFVDLEGWNYEGPQFIAENIELETIWIGNHRYLKMGYGPHINCLAVQDRIL